MSTDKHSLIKEITSAFSLTGEAAQTAILLLEARAKTLQFSFDEYMERYHPQGFIVRDESLPEQINGYTRFLGEDASAILSAGKGANFSTFVHECAHVFRRQLTGELREQAEKAFGVAGGAWDEDKEELFAKGLEQWIKRRRGKDKTRADVYNKAFPPYLFTIRSGKLRLSIKPLTNYPYSMIWQQGGLPSSFLLYARMAKRLHAWETSL